MKNLENCLLFKGLKSNQIDALFKNTPYQLKHFGKEDLIAVAETEVLSLFILLEGSVRGEMTDDSGKTIKIEDIEGPNLLAPAFLFGNNNRFPVTIIANVASEIMIVQKLDFLRLMQSNVQILSNFLNNISSRTQFLSSKLRFMSFQTLKGKLAHFFIQHSKMTGKADFICPKSQNQLAEMFGVARPSLSRAIREMDREGLIVAEGKNIRILNRSGLLGLLK
jgi:CRP/FNR family transcriptional regulator, dissimilatory nitrate respiration regulator